MTKRKITHEERELIASMREAGSSYREIGDVVNMNPNVVSWYCLIDGAEPPKPRALKQVPSKQISVERNGHVVRRFTVEEDQRLLELEAKGLSYAAIGRALGRRHNSVCGRLATLARHEERKLAMKAMSHA